MDKDLLKLLEDTGFTGKESQVYLALLELSQGNVTDISKITELKRSIIYVILEGLVKRGYVSEIPDKKINNYQATDPSVILRQLQTTAKNFSEMLSFFQTLHNKGKKRPKISYYETKDGIWNIYEEMSRTKKPFFISSYSSIKKYFPRAIEKWIQEDRKSELAENGQHLVPNNPEDIAIGTEFKKANQKVKVLQNIKELKLDFTVFGNKLAITSFENNPFIVVMESEELAKSVRALFEIIWQSAEELK